MLLKTIKEIENLTSGKPYLVKVEDNLIPSKFVIDKRVIGIEDSDKENYLFIRASGHAGHFTEECLVSEITEEEFQILNKIWSIIFYKLLLN